MSNMDAASTDNRSYMRGQHTKDFISKIRAWNDRMLESKYDILSMASRDEAEKSNIRSNARWITIFKGVSLVSTVAALMPSRMWSKIGLEWIGAIDERLKVSDEFLLAYIAKKTRDVAKNLTDAMNSGNFDRFDPLSAAKRFVDSMGFKRK